jgi:hypothetical protein
MAATAFPKAVNGLPAADAEIANGTAVYKLFPAMFANLDHRHLICIAIRGLKEKSVETMNPHVLGKV